MDKRERDGYMEDLWLWFIFQRLKKRIWTQISATEVYILIAVVLHLIFYI